ncbi:phosphatidylglycerophosphatase A [Rickettsiales bacterium LUAb2]
MNSFFKKLGNNILSKFFHVPEEVNKISKPHALLATFFGAGYFKYGPGTFASFIAVLIGLVLMNINHIVLFIVILVLLVLGIISSEKIVNETNNKDPQYIVIDEVVGQLIPFLLIGNNVFSSNLIIIAVIFILFRLLDIYKPWIIGKSETAFKGGLSVMIDDILAGIFTLFITFIILLFK